jgi:choline dehydrogenase-like flavoprotein
MLLAENTTTMIELGSRFTDVPFPGCEGIPFRSDAYWECYIRQYSITLHHIVGTCSMGRRGSKEAVVDPQLRVLGTEGLRVIDASVMPLLPISNTHAPSVMIGEKGAWHIKATWRNANEKQELNEIIR